MEEESLAQCSFCRFSRELKYVQQFFSSSFHSSPHRLLVTHDGYRLKVISSRQQFYYDSLFIFFYLIIGFLRLLFSAPIIIFHFSHLKKTKSKREMEAEMDEDEENEVNSSAALYFR